LEYDATEEANRFDLAASFATCPQNSKVKRGLHRDLNSHGVLLVIVACTT